MADSVEVNTAVSVTDVKIDNGVKQPSEDVATTTNDIAKNVKYECPDDILAPAEDYWTIKQDGAVKLRIGTTEYDNQAPMTVWQMFKNIVENGAEHTALAVKRDGGWKKWTYKEYYETCKIAAKGFIKLGLERFNSVGILGFNSPEWLFSFFGSIFAGGLSVGIYATNSPEACHFVAENSSANIMVVENDAQLSKILEIWDKLPKLKAVIQYTGKLKDKSNPNVYEWASFMELGGSCDDEELNKRLNALKVNQCCSLIYTSGTTGQPKGVMLSHDNMTLQSPGANWVICCAGNPPENMVVYIATISIKFVDGRYGNEHSVSFLPLSHIAAQLMDAFMISIIGGTLWFAQPDALKGTLVETLKEVRPTIFMAVPRVWEKIMEKMQEVGRRTTGIKKKIATWAKGVGLRANRNIEKGQSVPFGYTVANSLVFKKIAVALGLDRCRHCATGAAPITMETIEYFQSINLPLFELYGMSECSGPHSVGKFKANISGGCGRVMEGLRTKIDQPDEDGNGEICMNGRHVFMGYLNKEKQTTEIIDQEGFLHSGDIGKVDENGFLFITGRIKELIITAGGENIAPVSIEEKVKAEVPLISNIILIGDKRRFLSCLITLKVVMNLDTGAPTDQLTDAAIDYCKKLGSEVTTVTEFLKKKEENLMEAIQDGIDRYNLQALSRAQKIQKWCILEHDFSIPGGELGPTMKMRRPIIHKMYAEQIDAFYQ